MVFFVFIKVFVLPPFSPLDVPCTAVGLIDIPDEKELRELMEEIRRTA